VYCRLMTPDAALVEEARTTTDEKRIRELALGYALCVLALAENPATPKDLLGDFLQNWQGYFHQGHLERALAKNPNLPEDTLYALLVLGWVDTHNPLWALLFLLDPSLARFHEKLHWALGTKSMADAPEGFAYAVLASLPAGRVLRILRPAYLRWRARPDLDVARRFPALT